MTATHFRITLHGGGSYIQPICQLASALEGELDGIPIGDKVTLDFEPLVMTNEEYNKLPEFMGH